MDRYLKSQALLATSNTIGLVASVLGFDIVELWSGENSSCTYVHASEKILEAYNVSTGLYPTDRIHILSPRLCDLAKSSPNGYYWHVIKEREEKIKCFGSQAQTEMAFLLKGDEEHSDVFIVAFAMDKIQFKLFKTKFLSGLCFSIMVAVSEMDEDDDAVADIELDVRAGIARERLRYVSKFIRKPTEMSRDAAGTLSLAPLSIREYSSSSSELQFEIDEAITDFYVPIHSIPLILTSVPNYEITDFKDVTHMADGSNSNIYLGLYRGSQLVIKMMKKEVQFDEVALLEFDSEFALLSRVAHPNIISLVGKGKNPRKFLVLEYLSGGSLAATQNLINSSHGVSRSVLRKPTYTYEALLSLMKNIAEALNYLHSRNSSAVFIHRDIKPDNIGFTSTGVVKIFDFGLAAVVKRGRRSTDAYEMTGSTGSLRYMAPEVALDRPYNEKVDVYSFGIMVWQLATDRIPFKGLSREQFTKDVTIGGLRPKIDSSWPVGFRRLLESCWHNEFTKRPTFNFILDDLKALARRQKYEAISITTESTQDYSI